jgi:hypothetical protein
MCWLEPPQPVGRLPEYPARGSARPVAPGRGRLRNTSPARMRGKSRTYHQVPELRDGLCKPLLGIGDHGERLLMGLSLSPAVVSSEGGCHGKLECALTSCFNLYLESALGASEATTVSSLRSSFSASSSYACTSFSSLRIPSVHAINCTVST